MAHVVLENIDKRYSNTSIIKNLSITIKDGEFVTLLGPSGCGKSTLLRMIAGLEQIDGGNLFINGKKYNSIPPQKRGIAMVFQNYALFPHLSVRKNILFGLKIKKFSAVEQFERLEWVMELLHLQGLEKRLPKEISGGQRQRVALARALVLDPEVLLLDEPLSNLDAALRERALEELKRVHRKVGKTIIYVTHNQIEAMTMSEKIALIRDGKIEQYDSPGNLYEKPSTLFAAEFIGSPPLNILDGFVQKSDDGFVEIKAGGTIFKPIETIRPGLQRYLGQKILLGFRPQNISTELERGRRSTDTTLAISPEFVENLGDRILVIGKTLAGKTVRFLTSCQFRSSFEQKELRILIDGRELLFFDPQTQLNILSDHGTISI